jgi:hypothetical protein
MLGTLNQHHEKHGQSWLIALACIAAFIVFWGIAFASDVFQECVRNPYYYSAYHQPEKGFALIFSDPGRTKSCLGEFLIRDGEAITAFFTVVLGVSTIGLWASTWHLWGVTKDSVDLARKEFLSSHRPQIRIKHVQMTSKLWQGEKLVFRLVFVNAGFSDAFIHQYGIGIHIIRPDSYLPIDPEFPVTMASGQQKCPVGFTLVAPDLTDGTVLTDEQNVSIRNRTRLLYCTGFVEYTDAQGWMRKTAFCRVFEASLAPGASEKPGRFAWPPSPEPDYEYAD